MNQKDENTQRAFNYFYLSGIYSSYLPEDKLPRLYIKWDEKLDLIINKDQTPFSGPLYFSYHGNVIWVLNGKLHHPFKPAVVISERMEYWLEGIRYTFEQFWGKQKDTQYGPAIMSIILGSKE